MGDAVQYTEMGGSLYPCGKTIPRLDAGFYNITSGLFGWGVAPASPVSDELIDIKGTPADEIMEDIERFLATKERYKKAGLTHKRGYLFYGPPGCYSCGGPTDDEGDCTDNGCEECPNYTGDDE